MNPRLTQGNCSNRDDGILMIATLPYLDNFHQANEIKEDQERGITMLWDPSPQTYTPPSLLDASDQPTTVYQVNPRKGSI